MTQLSWNDSVDVAGGEVAQAAERMKAIGDEMYKALRALIDSGQLSGNGIATMLEQSQAAWNTDCDLLVNNQRDFANITREGLERMLDTDRHAAGFFD